jgi:6-phospho-beta-glucosidase
MWDEKIVILGGGSPFVPSLTYVMLENKEVFEGSEVCLMDINPTRLPLLAKLGEGMAKRAKTRMKFTWTADAKEALDGATFVMPSYRIGGEEHMRYDFEIPTKHGIAGDETAGPGGTFMAQCTIPATLEYCRMIEDLCPDAWAVSYVNPTNFVADAVRRVTKTRFIGLCDCFAGFAMSYLTHLFNMRPYERRYTDSPDLKARAIGVNHCTWLVDLVVNGKEGYGLLKSKVKEQDKTARLGSVEEFRLRLLEAYGYFSICPSHCRMLWEHDWVLKERKATLEREKGRLDSALGWSMQAWKFIEEMVAGARYEDHPNLYCFRLYHSRHVIGVIASIIANEGREWGGVNFVNNGAIPNLPSNAVVEGHCMVDKRGLTPIIAGSLPKPFLGITQHILNWQELTVDAALSGDKDLLYQAVLASPYVHDLRAAKVTIEELLKAHAQYMPQFRRKK